MPEVDVVGRVVLVEDHALLAQSVSLVLRHTGREVRVLGPTDDVVGVCDELVRTAAGAPVTVLLDLDLGRDVLGDRLVAPLHRTGAAVVVVTGATDPARLGECLLSGAHGVVDKSVGLDVLVESVQRAEDGRPVMAPARRETLQRRARQERERAALALAPFERLTEGEARVLAELVQGYRVGDIARRRTVSVTTVRAQVRAVLSKLGVSSQLEATALAHGSGWWSSVAGGATPLTD